MGTCWRQVGNKNGDEPRKQTWRQHCLQMGKKWEQMSTFMQVLYSRVLAKRTLLEVTRLLRARDDAKMQRSPDPCGASNHWKTRGNKQDTKRSPDHWAPKPEVTRVPLPGQGSTSIRNPTVWFFVVLVASLPTPPNIQTNQTDFV